MYLSLSPRYGLPSGLVPEVMDFAAVLASVPVVITAVGTSIAAVLATYSIRRTRREMALLDLQREKLTLEVEKLRREAKEASEREGKVPQRILEDLVYPTLDELLELTKDEGKARALRAERGGPSDVNYYGVQNKGLFDDDLDPADQRLLDWRYPKRIAASNVYLLKRTALLTAGSMTVALLVAGLSLVLSLSGSNGLSAPAQPDMPPLLIGWLLSVALIFLVRRRESELLTEANLRVSDLTTRLVAVALWTRRLRGIGLLADRPMRRAR